MKIDLNVPLSLAMSLKLLITIIDILSKVLVLITQVAALNWSDNLYTKKGILVKTPQKSIFWA